MKINLKLWFLNTKIVDIEIEFIKAFRAISILWKKVITLEQTLKMMKNSIYKKIK